jgi:hypothetical protein
MKGRNTVPDNFGASAKVALGLGVHMLGVFNARERSMVSLRQPLGWILALTWYL